MCDRFFPDEPEYDIEILEWIVEEDYTVEWAVSYTHLTLPTN